MQRLFLALLGICAVLNVWATDVKRELEYAEAISKDLAVGEIVWLETGGKKFLSIYTETEEVKSFGVAIILHDKDGHPDQKPLIHDLRTLLPQHNWATLSLQMPLREQDVGNEDYYVLFPIVVSRIQAAIHYLAQADVKNIALVGYGLGGLMALYSQNQLSDNFKAVIAISLPVPDSPIRYAQTLEFIKQNKSPLLDIYGSLDSADVIDSARKRRLAAKHNKFYRQIRINDQGHLYWHDEGFIVKRIYSWLRQTLIQ